jgi:hypothetical protein
MRRQAGVAVRLVSVLGLLCALAPAAAHATEPPIAIERPLAESATNDPMPLFVGTIQTQPGEEPLSPVVVSIHEGSSLQGPEVAQAKTPPFPGTSWFVRSPTALPDGTYTAQASEQGLTEASAPVAFRVDRTPPAVAIGAPAAGATVPAGPLAVSGSAGIAPGDGATVTVDIYAGAGADGQPLEGLELQRVGAAWSGALAGLGAGSYTLQAVQSDSAGNVGYSPPVPVRIAPAAPTPLPSPPKASFRWFPASPHVGEQVTLVSSSTDASSPLASFAWSFGEKSPFHGGGPTLETSFATAGPHVVRLQVTAADGQSGTATSTIMVHHLAAALMQPFPIVRIAGRETRSGVRLSLLTVTAPVSSHITVRSSGAGSRASSVSRLATAGGRSSGGGTALVSFPAFERALPAGAVLEVRVTKAGEIGKLTRLQPRRGKLPRRSDSCLSTTGQPIVCPAS